MAIWNDIVFHPVRHRMLSSTSRTSGSGIISEEVNRHANETRWGRWASECCILLAHDSRWWWWSGFALSEAPRNMLWQPEHRTQDEKKKSYHYSYSLPSKVEVQADWIAPFQVLHTTDQGSPTACTSQS